MIGPSCKKEWKEIQAFLPKAREIVCEVDLEGVCDETAPYEFQGDKLVELIAYSLWIGAALKKRGAK